MTFKKKIEILLHRKGFKKTEFAERIGITYRALANYLSGARKPKKQIMSKIESELNVTSDFLYDDNQKLILNSQEKFLFNASEQSTDIEKAMDVLTESKKLLEGNGLTKEDKQAFFSCFSEIYFGSVRNTDKNNQ